MNNKNRSWVQKKILNYFDKYNLSDCSKSDLVLVNKEIYLIKYRSSIITFGDHLLIRIRKFQ
jgi:hypothetical protein